MKTDVCNFENILFDDKSIIVDCILDFKDEYKIKAMIDNECIDYSFINIDIAHKVCELLRIEFLQLNKSREVKSYDEKRNKNITHVIYSFMTSLAVGLGSGQKFKPDPRVGVRPGWTDQSSQPDPRVGVRRVLSSLSETSYI
jgi:hypothetical protein